MTKNSNGNSNAGAPDRTAADYLQQIGADHLNHQTASDGFEHHRACLAAP
jgi:hypothetical protein